MDRNTKIREYAITKGGIINFVLLLAFLAYLPIILTLHPFEAGAFRWRSYILFSIPLVLSASLVFKFLDGINILETSFDPEALHFKFGLLVTKPDARTSIDIHYDSII